MDSCVGYPKKVVVEGCLRCTKRLLSIAVLGFRGYCLSRFGRSARSFLLNLILHFACIIRGFTPYILHFDRTILKFSTHILDFGLYILKFTFYTQFVRACNGVSWLGQLTRFLWFDLYSNKLLEDSSKKIPDR